MSFEERFSGQKSNEPPYAKYQQALIELGGRLTEDVFGVSVSFEGEDICFAGSVDESALRRGLDYMRQEALQRIEQILEQEAPEAAIALFAERKDVISMMRWKNPTLSSEDAFMEFLSTTPRTAFEIHVLAEVCKSFGMNEHYEKIARVNTLPREVRERMQKMDVPQQEIDLALKLIPTALEATVRKHLRGMDGIALN